MLVRLSALGDVVMVLPLLQALRVQYPNLRLLLVSQPFAEDLVSTVPGVEFMPARIRDRHRGIRGIWRLAREICLTGGMAKVADLHQVLRSRILLLFIRILRFPSWVHAATIRKGRWEKRLLVRGAIHRQLEHSVERYAEVVARLGYPVEIPYRLGGLPLRPLPEVLESLLHAGKGAIGIAPFAKHRAKMYPLVRMLEVAKNLQRNGYRLFLYGGGAQEVAILQEWGRELPDAVVVPGLGLRLGQELQLMARMQVVVSMDSANMHLASWAGVPVVSVWLATHPNAGFLAWGQSLANVVERGDLDCRPCSIFGNKPCRRGDYACGDIAPGVVVERVMGNIGRDKPIE